MEKKYTNNRSLYFCRSRLYFNSQYNHSHTCRRRFKKVADLYVPYKGYISYKPEKCLKFGLAQSGLGLTFSFKIKYYGLNKLKLLYKTVDNKKNFMKKQVLHL
jgi:hypothetical protein